jgi:two-component system repressor protein LuxO
MTPPLLLIEDTPSLQLLYKVVLQNAGHAVVTADTAEQGLSLFKHLKPTVLLLDLMLPDRDGLDLMRECLSLQDSTNVIVITANGSINRAVEAMRAGAYEFLVKPFDEQRLLNAVINAKADDAAQDDPGHALSFAQPLTEKMIGNSPEMRRVHARIQSVARSMASVFITGESGTGKELCAQTLHAASNRAAAPFVPLNCGAIPSDLMESEVFGHKKGSFTGAISDKPGAAALADGGTLFLDEVCEMDLNVQAKLLRFLQSSTIHPVGAAQPRKVNTRIICATSRDPLAEIKAGRFREDLYFRLHVVPIHLPPLRARADDILHLALNALGQFSKEEGKDFRRLDPEVEHLFQRLRWPGNVRQLRNTLRDAIIMHDGPVVRIDMLSLENNSTFPDDSFDDDQVRRRTEAVRALEGMTLAEIEQLVIETTITGAGNSIPKAAERLDVSPSTIYRKREGWVAAKLAARTTRK